MTPESYRGLEETLEGVEEAMLPATNEERMACLGELLTVFPMQDVGEGAREVRWGVYHKALGDLPADVLAYGCEQLMKTTRFFPKPAEIRLAAAPRLERRIKVLTNLKALRDMKVRVRGEGLIEAPTEEQKRRIASLARSACRKVEG